MLQYHFSEYYFIANVGLMRLMSQTVNSKSIDMNARTQYHVPVSLWALWKALKGFGLGFGFTHLTETTLYLRGEPVPESSYHQLFADLLLQLNPRITQDLRLNVAAIWGLNLMPGRQHIFTPTDLFHYRLQLQVGLLFALN